MHIGVSYLSKVHYLTQKKKLLSLTSQNIVHYACILLIEDEGKRLTEVSARETLQEDNVESYLKF